MMPVDSVRCDATPRRRLRALCLFILSAAFLAAAFPSPAAPTTISTDELLRAATAAPGFCVQIGCGDGTLTMRLVEKTSLVVHVLDSDARRVETLRDRLQARGLYGRVVVEPWTASWLPCADDLINGIVAMEAGRVSEKEMKRVLAPGGVAWIKRGGSWKVLSKPIPRDFDGWTHSRYGPSGNMVSRDAAVAVPAGVRWVAGPPQTPGGKKWYYDHVLVSSNGRNFYVTEADITARDAYNGRLLWSRPYKAVTFRETGAAVPEELKKKFKVARRTSKVRPVASGDLLYTVDGGKLVELDGRTGHVAAEFGPVADPRELLLADGLLVVSVRDAVRAYGAASREARWNSPLNAKRMVAGDGRLFCVSGDAVVALDLKTGKERWRTGGKRIPDTATCTYGEGVLVLEKSSWRDDGGGCGITVFAGTDGKKLWEKDYTPDKSHFQETRAYFVKGLLWLQVRRNQLIGYDPRTGTSKKKLGSRGKHCSTPVATERFFIAAECEFTDFETGSRTRARMFRSACRLPFIPANGLLNTFPLQCECFPMLRGTMGLAPGGLPNAEAGPRFVRGGAAKTHGAPPAADNPDQNWPMYRRDVYRSGSSPAALGTGALERRWATVVAAPPRAPFDGEWGASPFVRGIVTPPVAAGGRVVVAAPDVHRVTALDAGTGKVLWSRTAGGRVDLPPTLCGNLCLFGAHDGWVTCLDAGTGALVWKFRAAPSEARIAAYGQLESPWPVAGSILVEGAPERAVAYFAAGRHPRSDGGIRVYALEVRTGRVIWEQTVDTLELKGWYAVKLPNSKFKVGYDFEPVDVLVRDGDCVAMSRWRFKPADGSFKLDLANVQYKAFSGRAVPRGIWGYGIRQTKKVEPKPPAVFDGERIHTGKRGDVALLLAGGTLLAADAGGEIRAGERRFRLESPPVHDGLIAAYGRLYVSTRDGRVVCVEPAAGKQPVD